MKSETLRVERYGGAWRVVDDERLIVAGVGQMALPTMDIWCGAAVRLSIRMTPLGQRDARVRRGLAGDRVGGISLSAFNALRMTNILELGLHTFGDVTHDVHGQPLSQAQALRNVVTEAVLAEKSGVDFFGVGEHHRDDFAISAPEVVLAAIAGQTSRIRFGSAVTVLSSDDPIRVYQRFSTLDAVSSGRAEVILGRGSFIESFPLFGFDLNDYEMLFDEKLDLFVRLLEERPITWSGQTRPPLKAQRVYPPMERGALRTWIGSGGNQESVIRAARRGLPLMLAIIGGQPLAFAPLAELYRRALAQSGGKALPLGAHSPGYIAATDTQAREDVWPHYAAMHERIGRERGWPPMTRAEFERACEPTGALFIGAPETVATKVVKLVQGLSLSRFDLKYSSGTLPHEKLLTSIELYGTQVAPLIREKLSSS